MAVAGGPRGQGSAGRGAVAGWRDQAVGLAGRTRRWLASLLDTTPGWLSMAMVTLSVLGVVAGVAAAVGAGQRSSLVDDVRARRGPLAVQAQLLYRSLSDADATAAAAFLSSGAEPPALRTRYLNDIAGASAALAAVGSAGETDGAAVAALTASLPTYTSLVETARTYNRLNLPLGAAYLREASGLMRESLLPAASRLYQWETDRLGSDRSGAAEVPWLAIPLVLISLAALIYLQRYLYRRMHRVLNVGLVTATAGAAVLALWLTLSWVGVAASLSASQRDGSGQVEQVAQARITALRARADESLTLVARGSGAAFETDFTTNMAALTGPDGRGGLLGQARARATDPTVRAALDSAITAVARWRTVHTKIRELDDGGKYPEAVTLAVGDADTSAAAVFTQVDAGLATAIGSASNAFDARSYDAALSLWGTGVGLALLTVVVVAGVVVGLRQRIGEYR
jgi:hypothetical protein